jgi:hypothetical protein
LMSRERLPSTVSLVLVHPQRVEPEPPIQLAPDLPKSLGKFLISRTVDTARFEGHWQSGSSGQMPHQLAREITAFAGAPSSSDVPMVIGSRYSRHPPSSCSAVMPEVGSILGRDDAERFFPVDRPDAAQ